MIEIRLPKPGPEIENATITTWERSQGDKILIGDILAIIKTPIGSFKVAAEEQGILEDILQPEGSSINFDEPIAILKPEIKISDFPEEGVEADSTLPLPIEQPEPEKSPEELVEEDEPTSEEVELPEEKITLSEEILPDPQPPVEEEKSETESEGLKLVEPETISIPESEEQATEEPEIQEEDKITFQETVVEEEEKVDEQPELEKVEENGPIEESENEEPQEDIFPEISPAARKMAERVGIDLGAIKGTGDNGKVLYIDVENAILEKQEIEKAKEEPEPETPTVSLQVTETEEVEPEPEKILEEAEEQELEEVPVTAEDDEPSEIEAQQEDLVVEETSETFEEEDTFALTDEPEETEIEEEAEEIEEKTTPSVANIPYPDYEEISVQFHLAKKDDLIIPFNTVKKAHSETQSESNKSIPHFHLFAEVDFTEAEKWHKDFNERNNSNITITDLMVKACGHALALMPEMNAFVRPDRIILKRSINIGITTSVDEGVVTPVVPDVYHKSLQKVSEVIKKNKDLAETSKVVLDYDTTFTITNLGEYGVKRFIPTVTAPQSATLGIGKVMKQVVPVDDFFGIRSVMELTLSCDHRAIDGTAAARFIQTLTKDLESFAVGEDPDWIKGNEQLRLI